MELINDWKAYNTLWKVSRTDSSLKDEHTIYCVIDGEWIVDASTEGQDLSEWAGAPVSEFAQKFSNSKMVTVQWRELEASLQGLFQKTHWVEQREALKQEVELDSTSGSSLLRQVATKKARRKATEWGLGFQSIIDTLFQGRLSRFLPRHFGLYIHFSDLTCKNGYLLTFQNGALDKYFSPAFGPSTEDKVKYLADRYMIPVQGLECHSLDWEKWKDSQDPWLEIRQAFKTGKLKIFPAKKWIGALLFAKSVMRI